MRFLIIVVTCYVTVSTLLQTKDEFRFIIPYVEFSKQMKGSRPLVLRCLQNLLQIPPSTHGLSGSSHGQFQPPITRSPPLPVGWALGGHCGRRLA